MFDVLVKFKDQDACVFGIPNAAHVKALASMDNVEWVLGPINSTGCVLTRDANVRYADYSMDVTVSPTYPTPKPAHVCPQPPFVMSFSGTGFTPWKMADLVHAIKAEKKIQAIKLWREMSGMGLKESKDIVDRLYQILAPPF